MARSKHLLIGVSVIALVVAGAAWYRTGADRGARVSTSAVPVEASAAQQSARGKPSAIAPAASQGDGAAANNLRAGVKTDATGFGAYDVYRRAPTAREALVALAAASISAAERAYFTALIGELCSDPALEKLRSTKSGADAAPPPAPPSASVRDQARAALDRKRLRTYCDGMPILSAEARREAWEAAARAGDPRARLRMEWAAFEASFKADPNVPQAEGLPPEKTISPEAWNRDLLATAAQALAGKDPTAIVNVGHMLQHTAHSNFVALSANGESLANIPVATWQLLACYYGADCGPQSTTLLNLCANEGRCDATTLEEHYRRNIWTPEEAARFDALLPYLRQFIDTGDTRLLTIRPFEPGNLNQPRYYGKPPRRFNPG